MREIANVQEGTVVAIDGKTMCGTKEKGNAKSNIHIVSAWCSSDKLVLGQVKTDEKSNEITAISELLDMLFIKGCIVTTDAMGCQKDIAKKIVYDKKADYVFVLKGNHPLLTRKLNDAEAEGFKNKKIEEYRTIEKGHGRIEERIYYFSTDINWMDAKDDRRKLKGVGMVIRRCERAGVKTEERAYHIASVKQQQITQGVSDFTGVLKVCTGV